MADNFVTNAASGGAQFASDDIAGVHWPWVKLAFGADDAVTKITTSSGLPVQQQSGASFVVVGPAADGAALSGAPVRVGGSDGANVQDIAVTNAGHVQIHDGGNSITVDGPLTDAQLRASGVPVIAASLPLPSGGAVVDGTLAATTAAAALGSQACKSLVVQNDPDNAADLFVGDATNQRTQLVPGQALSLPVSNVGLVYARMASGTGNANWIAIT